VWPLAARAQQAKKLPTIGFLGASTASISGEGQRLAAFVQRLRELGRIEGRNIAIEYRWAEGRSSRAAEIAAEFVRLKVDVIVTYSTSPVLAAKQATSVIPIVFAAANEPGQSRVTSRSNSQPSSISSSTSLPPKYLASKFPRRCSPAPTR
jgi:putative ABC transport system substrate-binding protein